MKIKISEKDLNPKTNNTNLCCSLVLIFSLRCSWKKKNFLWYFPIFRVSLSPKRPGFNILNLTHILKWIALHRYHQINCAKPNYAKNWNNILPQTKTSKRDLHLLGKVASWMRSHVKNLEFKSNLKTRLKKLAFSKYTLSTKKILKLFKEFK